MSTSDQPFPLTTATGLSVKAHYGHDDVETDDDDRLGLPGAFPYTRGITPEMYRDDLWVMGQYSGYASPKETNRRILELVNQGQRGFSIALDLPTQNGLDSDHPLAQGEVGKVGVPLDSLLDVEELFKGIPFESIRQIRTTANSIGPIAAALFIAGAETLGSSPNDLRVLFQNDVLKEYVARGTQIFPPRRGLEFSVDLVEYCARNLPHWEPIEFCGYHIRDAGANAIQEVGIAIGNGIEYIESTLARGLPIDSFAPNIFLFLSANIDIFEEVAKYRAARRVWAHLMKERFGAKLAESQALNIFVYTLGGSLAAQEPLNNLSRVAFEALAAVLGGVQTLATSSYDEAIGLPTAEAAHLSLRAQQLIAYETGVARTADPLGGSYYVEWLTDRLAHAIEDYLEKLDEQGGALSALESGWIGREIEDEAYRQQRELEDGTRPKVGVNILKSAEPSPTEAFEIPVNVEADQIAKLDLLRQRRDRSSVEKSLDGLRAAVLDGENTVEPILEAVRAYATVGEITAVLKQEWGSYR